MSDLDLVLKVRADLLKYISPIISGESQFESELTLDERRAFLKKPSSERRSILAQQAEKMLPHYQLSDEWRELMAGDIIDDQSKFTTTALQ
jgi:hypothetical protein